MHAALTPLHKTSLESNTFTNISFFFFLLFKIKSQKKRHGTDFSNYQVSCHLLLQTKYHIIPYFINPLQSFRFFHYFALSHKKVKCKIPESKKKFIPIPFFYADN